MKNFAKILLALMLGALVIFSSVACDLDENTSGYSDDDEDDEDEEDEKDVVVNDEGEYVPEESEDIVNPGGATARPFPGSENADENASVNDEGEYVPEESEDIVNPGGATVRPYPGSTAAQVEEMSVSDLVEKVVDAMENVQSCELVADTINSVTVNGELQEQNLTAKSTVNFSNDVFMYIESEVPGVAEFESYVVDNGNTVDIYYYYLEPQNMWVKQTGIPKNAAKSLNLYYDSFADDNAMLYIEQLALYGDYNETSQDYVLSGDLALNEELLGAAGLDEIMNSLLGEGISESDIQRILSSLSEMHVEMLIDKNTFEIKSMEVDLSKTGKDLYDTLFDVLAPDMEVSVVVNDYRVKSEYKNYNRVRTVELPEEAQNAQEMTIFQY